MATIATHNSTARGTSRRHRVVRRAFTFLELIVALMVFSIAVAGLYPLLVIMSRDLQPLGKRATDGTVTYDCTTPARDGTKVGVNLAYTQHTWYLTPFDQPWARKLGAGARVLSDSSVFAASTRITSVLPVMTRDDDEDTTDSDGDGAEDYTQTGHPPTDNWTAGATGSSVAGRDDYHCFPSLPVGQTPGFASWSFLTPSGGWYAIEATWPTGTGLAVASDAQFGITVTGGVSNTVTVNQQNAPADEQDAAGTWWARLGSPIYVPANTRVTVSLHVNGHDVPATYVIADGVRMVGIENNVRVDGPVVRSPSIVNGNSSNEDATVHASVTINLPQSP
ncbi:MAG: prepilin-type N-terminal cleavage/methylation domain-containing protein [Planctomycetaceae bacterium]|nr:prepilin-type N-terminal cleavage/methylation domain-containing protein [Planctomycetaceae bacterium]